MLVAYAWVTLAASMVPKTLPQPTRPAVSHRGAASSMFLPLTGARQSSSAELSSSQKQLSQQLAQWASGSTLSLNLNGCASHRACTRVLHTQRLPLRTCRSTRSSSLPSALCSSLSALRTPLSALRTSRSALCSLLSAHCALCSAHCVLCSAHCVLLSALRTPHAPSPCSLCALRSLLSAHAPRCTPHATHRTPHNSVHTNSMVVR